ncbi:MAG TPA: hypothetical protein VHX11_07840 [Acidobacteriaceae bacterium]|jgi:hypothetical protein|nr:hypothetical protein [Acidobacteriaceae bacterium]
MKKLWILPLLFAAICAQAQYVRYDAPFPSVSSTTSTPFLVANVPPNSPTIAVCHSPANQVPCTNYATTYTSTGSACPNGAQDTPQPQPSACQTTGDAQGNIGFWAIPGTYDYTVCISGTVSCFGPYTVTLGGSSGANIFSLAGGTAPIGAVNLCPTSGGTVNPSLWLQKSDSTYYGYAGVDTVSPRVTPAGYFSFCGPVIVNDTGAVPDYIRNAAFSVSHMSGNQTLTGANVDDRAIGFRISMKSTANPTWEQYLGVYGEAFIDNNNATNSGTAGTETGFGVIRTDLSDQRTAGTLDCGGFGCISITGYAEKDNAISTPYSSQGLIGVAGISQNSIASNLGGVRFTGVKGYAIDATGAATNGVGTAFYALDGYFPTENDAFFCDATWNSGTNSRCFWSVSTAANHTLGKWSEPEIDAAGIAALPLKASITGVTSFATAQLSGPALVAVTPVGTTGSTTYTYQVVAVDGNGGTVAGATHSTTTGNATLSGTNYVQVDIASASCLGAARCDLYRTAGGATQGKIASFSTNDIINSPFPIVNDTGLAGDSASAPTVNTTGGSQSAAGYQSTAAAFANLPACASGLEGSTRAITDSTTNTWGDTITGSGSDHVLGYCDGTNWTVAAK